MVHSSTRSKPPAQRPDPPVALVAARLTVKEAAALGLGGGSPRPSKYHSTRTKVGDITFASSKEAKRYAVLRRLEDLKLISDLTLQPRFPLHSRAGNQITTMVADFSYRDLVTNKLIVEDVKGYQGAADPVTRLWRLKKALAEGEYPHLEFRIV